MRKFPEKLGKCELYAEFKNPLKSLIYESFTVDEFESRWLEFMKKYGLEENEWLCDLFEERHMWIPAYMKEYFWAGMKTTQRVESINSFFDGFVNRKTKLYEFPKKYSKAMTSKVTDETEADAKSTKYVWRLVSGFKVEKVYQKLYADAKFQEIKKELSRMMYCYGREERVIDEHNVHYYLEDRVWIVPEGRSEEVITDRRRIYCVRFNRVTNEVSCDYCKFETFGIFCKHCIRVLDQNLVFKIPYKYILDRWRKDVVRKHTRVKVAYHDPSDTAEVKRFNKIMSEFEPICDEASAVDEDTVQMVLASLLKLRIEVKERRKKFIAQNGVQLLPSR
ncbi:protein FAR1-RELATED SEQUENCE 6-like isoform X2 [Chenopodium quinoa]|uniref:protein FAR1-RELATED SEQUENCE 6-like isoform X2 n=1 Tax=Chenopodium quinoa TaxID=63459 RepID=UPI000B78B4AD|nr:protein FAR1-RELATED SEQUENCE 6-like isoform X2 [Chenopodium quinoa]